MSRLLRFFIKRAKNDTTRIRWEQSLPIERTMAIDDDEWIRQVVAKIERDNYMPINIPTVQVAVIGEDGFFFFLVLRPFCDRACLSA